MFWTLESVTGTLPSPGVGALIIGVPAKKSNATRTFFIKHLMSFTNLGKLAYFSFIYSVCYSATQEKPVSCLLLVNKIQPSVLQPHTNTDDLLSIFGY